MTLRLPSPFDYFEPAVFAVRSSQSYAPQDNVDRLTRPGHLYRGVSEAEWLSIQQTGVIQSDMRHSFSCEGTCFAGDAGAAEDYANFGRGDPRKTGRPNYLIEIVASPAIVQDLDGYWKTRLPVPKSAITRAWRMSADGTEIIAQRVV